MRRKITIEFILTISLSIILFVIGGYLITKSNINNVTELNLNKYLDIMKIEYEVDQDVERIVDKYQEVEDFLRITFISSDGSVLKDSLAQNLENHLDRPEINNLGTVFIRHSETLNIEMMYLAYQFDDTNYLRVAMPTSTTNVFLNDYVGLSIVIGVLVIAITVFISNSLIQNALQPLKDVKGILRQLNNGEYEDISPVDKYEEINDLVREINDTNKLIANNISSLKSETEKTDFLLNHMNQGICVLDKDGLIVMLNQYLRRLYKFNIDLNMHKDYRFLFRDTEIQKSIKKAYKKQTNTNTIIKIKEMYYSVSINYLDKNWLNQPSVILLFTDITAIKSIEVLKKDFFDNASHELKSPLTSIIGSSDIILQGMAPDEQTKIDLIHRISEEAKRMNTLVMDMLTLSKYENQDKIYHRQELDIDIVIQDAVHSLQSLCKKKNNSIEIDSQEFYFNANYDEMFQIIKNLVENAIKYGKENGLVKISLFEKNNFLVIKIKDDGIGIAKADQTRVFERFFRVDKARSRLIGGTGLGLSIVKHIVLNYDGHLELDSIENNGTTIKVYLPLKTLK